jgi:hypothetical protein
MNESGDLIPADEMYRATRLAGRRVERIGHHEWDCSRLTESEPPPDYRAHVARGHGDFGFKLPETTFSLPWLVKMYPHARYLHWTRDPRDAVMRPHFSDDLPRFAVPSEYTPGRTPGRLPWPDSPMEARIESYIYQRRLVAISPRPEHFLEVSFEDFILDNARITATIGDFVGRPLAPVTAPLDARKVDRSFTGFPERELREFGYA